MAMPKGRLIFRDPLRLHGHRDRAKSADMVVMEDRTEPKQTGLVNSLLRAFAFRACASSAKSTIMMRFLDDAYKEKDAMSG